ncbi:MAG: MBL fold metallo-hydrolase [Gemmatimonadota bacterium]|nr:MBL fold metallo-hydrolase [Gemmatimonadota bacterium]
MQDASPWSRRGFLRQSASCAAHVGLMSALAPVWAKGLRASQEQYPVVSREPWGRIERIAEGIWALVSDPMQDRTTLCNGGIIAGRSGVVLIEAFGSEAGFEWMASEARRLAGRSPTHVVVTHYHGDHTAGLGAVADLGAEVLATPVTRDLTRGNNQVPNPILNLATPLDTIRPTEIDLGDRSLIIVPRRGHTDSDVTIEVTDPTVVFCGDLVWNEMFPNYVDATPSRLTQAVTLMRASAAQTYVPGHGPLADIVALDRYLDLLRHVESAARDAIERGFTSEEAGEEYRLPPAMRDWTLFSDVYFARAIGAWMKELGRP